MKIQIASDLHLEFKENRKWIKQNPLIPKGDVLLLAGDIVSDEDKIDAWDFYQKISGEFPFIISTMGNHEFYYGEIGYAYPSYRNNISDKHIKLNNQSIIVDGVKFIVSTLWTNIPKPVEKVIRKGLNDYKLIYLETEPGFEVRVKPKDTSRFYWLSVKFIKEELQKPFDGKIVVMTHHIPSFQCLTNRPPDPEMNSAYASNLEELIINHPNIKYWITGHSHDFNITTIGKTQVIRNPLGYVQMNDQDDFRRDFVVEV